MKFLTYSKKERIILVNCMVFCLQKPLFFFYRLSVQGWSENRWIVWKLKMKSPWEIVSWGVRLRHRRDFCRYVYRNEWLDWPTKALSAAILFDAESPKGEKCSRFTKHEPHSLRDYTTVLGISLVNTKFRFHVPSVAAWKQNTFFLRKSGKIRHFDRNKLIFICRVNQKIEVANINTDIN